MGRTWYKYDGLGTKGGVAREAKPFGMKVSEPSSFLIVGLAIILFLIDIFFSFNGFNYDWVINNNWILAFSSILSAFIIVNIALYLMKPADGRTLVSRMALWATILLIFTVGGFYSAGGMAHFIIPFLMYFLWARNVSDESSANFIFTFLWIFDFIGYGFFYHWVGGQAWSDARILAMLSNRLIIHVWGYYALFSAYSHEKNPITTFLIIILIGSLVFYATDDGTAIAARMGYLNPELKNGWFEYMSVGWGRLRDTWKSVPGEFNKYKDAQLEYATGGYYRSEVEKNEEEPLGVYIENLQSAQENYYQNDPIVIWADLRAKTLNDPINISLNCSTGTGNNKVLGEMKPDYYPNEKTNFQIVAESAESLQCRFGSSSGLQPATHSIKIEAEFNFETLAYLKTYFMDIERIRALKRSNIDPLNEYGITDKAPTAKYTNGPVRIGIGTNTDLPVGLGQDYIQSPRLGITIENQWNGKVKNITKLLIQIPESMDLESVEENGERKYCNGWFEPTDYANIGEELQDPGYKTYRITEEGRKTIKYPIETFESIICLIEIQRSNVDDILGTTPVATHYYRAHTDYDYYIENTISASVIADPNAPTEMTSCTDKCNDNNGCKCINNKCNDYDLTVGKDDDCGGLKTGSSSGSTTSSLAPTDMTIKIRASDGTYDTTNDPNVILELTGTNIYSCQFWNYADSGINGPNVWELYQTEKSWTLNTERNGPKRVYYQCKSVDSDGNQQLSPNNIFDEIEYTGAVTSTTHTQTPHDLEIEINQGDPTTNINHVVLTVKAKQADFCAYINDENQIKSSDWIDVSGEGDEWNTGHYLVNQQGPRVVTLYCKNSLGISSETDIDVINLVE